MRDVFSPGLFENKRAFVSGGSSSGIGNKAG